MGKQSSENPTPTLAKDNQLILSVDNIDRPLEIIADSLPPDVDIIKEFENFLAEHYRGQANKPSYDRYDFASETQLKSSNYYKKLTDEQKKRYRGGNNPSSIIELKFNSVADMCKFLQRLEQKNVLPPGTVSKFQNDLTKYGTATFSFSSSKITRTVPGWMSPNAKMPQTTNTSQQNPSENPEDKQKYGTQSK